MQGFKNEEDKKKAIFDSMSPRRQRWILKRGYENWNPFQEPKDPIDIRTDRTMRTARSLAGEFLSVQPPGRINPLYKQGVMEMAIGIVNEDEKIRAMMEFSWWYRELLDKED